MLNKFKNFCGKPITYGAYFKACGAIVAITAVELLALMYGPGAIITYKDFKEFKEKNNLKDVEW